MNSLIYIPEILDLSVSNDLTRYDELYQELPKKNIFDYYLQMQREYIKISFPDKVLSVKDIETIQKKWNHEVDIKKQGRWIYYPWRDYLVHILEEDQFIALRTTRNLYKITNEERDLLSEKKVGIIGLSVGHSVAMNLALERSVGELRLADFDSLELSNLNRIRTTIFNIGLPKVVTAAREIAELDPFIKVTCYQDGISEENMTSFFLESGKLDLLVEECDSLHIKILSRIKAKELKIPVLMETSDRGMIDVERYDLESDRPILHGLIDHLKIDDLKNLKTSEEKVPFLMPMVGIDTMSKRLKASALEVGQSIGSWPQLGSSVMLGGALVADTYRRIILGQFTNSGRYIVDPSDEIKDQVEKEINKSIEKIRSERKALSKKEMIHLVQNFASKSSESVDVEIIKKIVAAAGMAPSGGNSQPWKWLFYSGKLYLFFEHSRSESYMDYNYSASFLSLGASLENAVVMAASLGYRANCEPIPNEVNDHIIAILDFRQIQKEDTELAFQIPLRYTDRRIMKKVDIPKNFIETLKTITSSQKNLQSYFIDSDHDIDLLAQVVSLGDWIRIMYAESHKDFIHEEMRWSREHAEKVKDGIFVEELSLSPSDLAGLRLLKDESVVEFLNEHQKGFGLKDISRKIVNSSSLTIAVFSNEWNKNYFVEAGQMMERIWLMCTKEKIGFQIINVPIAFLLRLKNDDIKNFGDYFQKEIYSMKEKMEQIIPNYLNKTDLFFVRLFVSTEPEPTSLRLNLEDILEIE